MTTRAKLIIETVDRICKLKHDLSRAEWALRNGLTGVEQADRKTLFDQYPLVDWPGCKSDIDKFIRNL